VNHAEAANPCKVIGIVADAAVAEATLYGADLGAFLAREVEVE
jgi:hypothetical protein